MIYVLCCERSVAPKLLSLTPLIFIGDISYSLYFVHTDIFPMFRVSPSIDLAAHIPMLIGRCAAFLTLAIVVSSLTYRFLEKPARTMITQASGGRGAGASAKLRMLGKKPTPPQSGETLVAPAKPTCDST